MKALFLFLFLVVGQITLHGQNIVIHEDLMQRVAENTASKNIWLEMYDNELDQVKSDRETVLGNWTIIEEIQKKIYSSLTNVNDAIKNGRQIKIIAERVPLIVSNVTEAGQIAIGKPYLIVYWNGTGQLLIDKALELQTFLTEFILSHDNDSLLIDQVTRDQLVWQTYNRINTIYNISNSMVSLFKRYTLQMAVNKIVPYQWYINLDKAITKEIFDRIKFW